MEHRHFKAVKLAAAYAFIDSAVYLGMDHWKQAVALAELSGEAFHSILKRDKSYAKLAKYIASSEEELTHADLFEELPFYRGTKTEKEEMMNLAIGHGYKHGIYIKRERGIDNIDFFSGKMLTETKLDKMIIAYGEDITTGYLNNRVPFDQLHHLVARDGFHWCAHQLKDGYRKDENCLPGCNLAVIDVDDGVSLDTAKMLLADYHWIMHTTKSHTADAHRFRIIIPLSHEVELDSREYKEFMSNIYQWMPFGCDEQTNDRPRKWLTAKGNYWYNDGDMLDALQFIPKTKKAEHLRKVYSTQGGLDHLERWFVNKIEDEGHRNNQLRNYAFFLVEKGHDIGSVTNNVLMLNTKLQNPLSEDELMKTVILSSGKRIHERDTRGK